MEIVQGRGYRVVVRFPWGELRTYEDVGVIREADGTLHWESGEEAGGLEPFCDMLVQETDRWIMGWMGGTCDTPVVISIDEDAPEP